MDYTAIPGKPRWVDLSDQHKIARQQLESRLQDYFAGKAVPPLAIVGAFGSGKSELMSIGFRLAWENEFPAFWLNLEDLLSFMPEHLTPKEFTAWLDQKVMEQVKILKECISGKNRLGELFLPRPREVQTVSDYFSWLQIPLERAQNAANKTLSLLFLDEMEAHYTDLLDRVPSDDRAPLRVLQQAVAQKETPFFLVMSFGLASAYEALSGAEARRRGFLPVPLPGPSEFAKNLLDTDSLANFMWWCSRGRPGWALPLWDSWKAFLMNWKGMSFEQIYDLLSKTPNIEGLPVVNWKAVTGIPANALETLKDVLLSLGPTKLSDLQGGDVTSKIDELSQYFYLGAAQELVSITALEDALISDVMKLSAEYVSGSGELMSEMKLREYLKKILRSLSGNGQVCFGGWKNETDAFIKGWIAPLITLLHDFILEFEGDTEEGSIIVDCLYRMGASWDVFSGQVKDPWLVASKFSKTKTMFKPHSETSAHYIQATPKLVDELFPRLVVKPVLRLSDKAESDIAQQRSSLKGSISTGGPFLTDVIYCTDIHVEFIFLPSADLCNKLQQAFFQQIHRDDYLPFERVFVVLNLDEELREVKLDASHNSDILILTELGKLCIEPLKERRLQDFLISLWYNSNVLALGHKELSKLLGEIPNVMRLSKASRRTIDHYRSLAKQFFERLGTQIASRYQNQIRQIFPLDDSEFPESRVRSLVERIRLDRASDAVAAAVGVYYSKVASLTLLGQMRDLAELRKFSTGYEEFLENHSVIKEKGTYGASASMRDILDYLDHRRGFTKLLEDILPKLAFMPAGVALSRLTEDLEDTPIDHMFASLSRPDRLVFLKSLYMTSLLSSHRQRLLQEIALVKSKITATAKQYEALADEIAKFNNMLNAKVISDAKCRSIGQQLTKLSSCLDVCDNVPPVTAYVAYRIATAMQEKAQDVRDEWIGEKGLQGWRDCLRIVTELQERTEAYERQLKQAFSKYDNLKTDALGNVDTIITQKVKKPIKESAIKVLQALGSAPYELADGVPKDKIDVESVKEALSTVNDDINHICTLADQIENLMDATNSLSTEIVEFSARITKEAEDESKRTAPRRKK